MLVLVVRGSWFVVRGSWFVVRGSWFVVQNNYDDSFACVTISELIDFKLCFIEKPEQPL
jgi:hypothetical protein